MEREEIRAALASAFECSTDDLVDDMLIDQLNYDFLVELSLQALLDEQGIHMDITDVVLAYPTVGMLIDYIRSCG